MSCYRTAFTTRDSLLAEQFAVGLGERAVGLCEAAARERFEADSAG